MTLATQNLSSLFCLQNAVYELQTQAVMEERSPASQQEARELYNVAVRAHQQLGALDGIVSQREVWEIGHQLTSPQYTEAYRRLQLHLPYLSNIYSERRKSEDVAIRAKLSQVRRIVGGVRTIDGLLKLDEPVIPSVPSWARKFALTQLESESGADIRTAFLNRSGRAVIGRAKDVEARIDERTVSRRHAEILFHQGSYWIRDLKSLLGTFVRGQRLVPNAWCALWTGSKIFAGEQLQLDFPVRPELDRLAAQIASQSSIPSLVSLLHGCGYAELAQKIANGSVDVPQEGGLSLKVYELLLETDYRAVKEKFFPKIGDGLAFDLLSRTADAIASARTRDELVSALSQSPVPNLGRWAEEADKHLRGAIFSFLRGFPEELGIRWKVEELSRKK